MKERLLSDLDEDGFSAYPNPATSELTITSEDVINSMRIYSITGKIIDKPKSKCKSNTS